LEGVRTMRITDGLSLLGVVVALGAKIWEMTGKSFPGKYEYYLIAGLALIVTHVVLRWDDIVRTLGRRQMMYGGNTLVLGVAVLGILGLANYFAAKYSKRWDFTKSQRYSLSDQTKKVVASLKDDVSVLYFQRSSEVGPGRERLTQMQQLSPKLKVEFVDPIATPAKARENDVTTVPTLLVVRGAKREKLGNDSEQDVVNALIKVTRGSQKTVCFVTGEGERDLDDFGPRGLNGLKDALGKSQYQTKKLLLVREPKVPDDCTVVVLPGPEKDLEPQAVDALRSYVQGGGRVLVLLEPEFKEPTPKLVALLKEWNLEPGSDLVLDFSLRNQLSNTGPETPLAENYPMHDITKDFRPATAFHTARSVKAGTGTSPTVSAQSLVETSADSWAEADFRTQGKLRFDEGKDQQGPISLGAVATIRVASPSPSPAPAASPGASPAPSPSPEEPPKKEGRVVAFGDADFASNALLGFIGNRDFALNTVAWLAEDPDLISIRPREPDDQRLFLTHGQQQFVALLALVLLPVAFIVWGGASWWRRRG
jgi:gliding motility-associatede transport system auxiliary component